MAKVCFFDKMVKRYGENWVSMVPPEEIQKRARQVVSDMVRGIIDYKKHGAYFMDPKFMDNMIIAVQNDYEYYLLHYNALSFYRDSFPALQGRINVDLNDDYAKTYINDQILQRLKLVREEQNIGYLADVGGVLALYRNHLT